MEGRTGWVEIAACRMWRRLRCRSIRATEPQTLWSRAVIVAVDWLVLLAVEASPLAHLILGVIKLFGPGKKACKRFWHVILDGIEKR